MGALCLFLIYSQKCRALVVQPRLPVLPRPLSSRFAQLLVAPGNALLPRGELCPRQGCKALLSSLATSLAFPWTTLTHTNTSAFHGDHPLLFWSCTCCSPKSSWSFFPKQTYSLDEKSVSCAPITRIFKLLSPHLVIACICHLIVTSLSPGQSCFCAYDHSVGRRVGAP